jgi:ATP synthase protein I
MTRVSKTKNQPKTGYAYYHQKQKTLIYKSIKLQVIAILLITVIMAWLSGLNIIYSVIVGGLCALIPNIYFAYYSFFHKYNNQYGAREARKILNKMYVAEAIKFILIFCLLTISYSSEWFKPQGILIGFIFVYINMIFLPLINK